MVSKRLMGAAALLLLAAGAAGAAGLTVKEQLGKDIFFDTNLSINGNQSCADCHAPEAVIAAWLAERQSEGRDPSDATLAVIKDQEAGREPLDADEQAHSGRIDTHEAASLDGLVERIRRHLPGI